MTEENKPLETDTQEEAKETQVAPEGEGQEDVRGDATDTVAEGLTLEEINSTTGRKFNSKDEFLKTFKNLNSMVGSGQHKEEQKDLPESKQAEPVKDDALKEIRDLKASLEEKEFLASNPGADKQLELVKALAEKNNMTLQQAYQDKVKPAIERKESNIGVRPTGRVAPVSNQNNAEIINQAKQGSDAAQMQLVNDYLNRSQPDARGL